MKTSVGGESLREGWIPLADTPDLTLFSEIACCPSPWSSRSVHMGFPKRLLGNVGFGVSSHLDSDGPK